MVHTHTYPPVQCPHGESRNDIYEEMLLAHEIGDCDEYGKGAFEVGIEGVEDKCDEHGESTVHGRACIVFSVMCMYLALSSTV